MAQPTEEVRPSWRSVLASNVWARRRAVGWSQERLAHESGVSKETVRIVESAREGAETRSVQLETVFGIAEALGVDPAELLRFDPEATRVYLEGKAATFQLLAGDLAADVDRPVQLATLTPVKP